MSMAELLVVFIVALVVLGPERLPAIARLLGRTIAKVRDFTSVIQKEFDKQLQFDQLDQNEKKAAEAEKKYRESQQHS